MTLSERIAALVQWSKVIDKKNAQLSALVSASYRNNNWFTEENYWRALLAIKENMLDKEQLEKWTAAYSIPKNAPLQTVGLIMAGNIPLVGFHDLLTVFISGNKAQIKLSDKDPHVLPYLLEELGKINPHTKIYFEIVPQLKNFDIVIATGSNNTARYFEQYFAKYPHIIRKNRNSIAVLTGKETAEDFHALGKDIFAYFGLGCRNVAKIYVPKDYDFKPLMEGLHEFRDLIQHNKYKNNFDYNFTLLILNGEKYYSNGCLLVHENESLTSRIASLHYEEYEDLEDLEKKLLERHDEIQCIVAGADFPHPNKVAFGKAQQPKLWDYADGVDTLQFLLDQNPKSI